MTITEAQLLTWVSTFWLPFVRIAGAMMAAPIFGNRNIPMRVRILLGLLVAILVTPNLPESAAVNPLSVSAMLMAANELLIGIMMGFLIQLIFEAFMFAAQMIATGMGLAFSVMTDPQQGISIPVLGQFLMLITTLLFLSMNGHLEFLNMVAGSFQAWPVGQAWLGADVAFQLAGALSDMFRGAVRVALPAVMALLVVQIAMGVVSRAAPTLNLFAVGFPIAIFLGFVVVERILPGLLPILDFMLTTAVEEVGLLLQGGSRVD